MAHDERLPRSFRKSQRWGRGSSRCADIWMPNAVRCAPIAVIAAFLFDLVSPVRENSRHWIYRPMNGFEQMLDIPVPADQFAFTVDASNNVRMREVAVTAALLFQGRPDF